MRVAYLVTQRNDTGIVTACHVTTAPAYKAIASSAAPARTVTAGHSCITPHNARAQIGRTLHKLAICAAGRHLNGFVLGSGDTNRLCVFE